VPNNPIVTEDLAYIFESINAKDAFKGSILLISGCAGFLGYYFLQFLCRYKEELGIKSIIGLDSFILGHPEWLKDLQLENNGYLNLVQADISDPNSWPAFDDSVNYVIHMASVASPTFYRQYPLKTIRANVNGLEALLERFKDKNLKSFLFFSSSEIYGDPPADSIPTTETFRGLVSTMGPRACYDEAKRFGETLCSVYANEYKMPIVIVRPFNNYGPGMRLGDKRVPADFCKAVVSGKDITLFSDGSPTRTFCYISDAIIGYFKALLHQQFDVFNIGIETPEISILKLAEIFKNKGETVFGYTNEIQFQTSQDKQYLTDNPSRRCPSLKKSKELLGFNPQISVDQGVERFLNYIKFESMAE
jgi:UDP-glucuronate decarboxylase